MSTRIQQNPACRRPQSPKRRTLLFLISAHGCTISLSEVNPKPTLSLPETNSKSTLYQPGPALPNPRASLISNLGQLLRGSNKGRRIPTSKIPGGKLCLPWVNCKLTCPEAQGIIHLWVYQDPTWVKPAKHRKHRLRR